jgi:tartrate-resistant acid phosphatase type 5
VLGAPRVLIAALALIGAADGREAGSLVSDGSAGTLVGRERRILSSSTAGAVFAVKGDWGAGTPAQSSVTRRMCRVRLTQPFDVVVTTGDNFYNPDGVATKQNYGDPERCLTVRPGHRWIPAWGNHDLAGDSTATVLRARGHWYRWPLDGVEILVLDSNRWSDSTQRGWLARTLKRFDVPLTVVAFHHPPFSVGTVHGSHRGVRERWVPLFERHGVDLVLSGHNHLYERSRLRGIDYVVTGGGGAALYGCGDPASWTRRCVSAHHFLLVQAADTGLRVRAVSASGSILDRFVVRDD